MRKCTKCQEEKPIEEFYKYPANRGNSPHSICKSCEKKQSTEYVKNHKESTAKRNKEYREKNLKRLRDSQKKYRQEHKELIRERNRIYEQKNAKYVSEYKKLYRNRPEVKKRLNKNSNEKRKLKRKNDITYKITELLRSRLTTAIWKAKSKKFVHTLDLVGCDIKSLISYLESKFLPGMTWENHGVRGWHIDHILPCASFDLTKEDEQRKCFHYTNLQPLWARDNIRKKDKLPPEYKLTS